MSSDTSEWPASTNLLRFSRCIYNSTYSLSVSTSVNDFFLTIILMQHRSYDLITVENFDVLINIESTETNVYCLHRPCFRSTPVVVFAWGASMVYRHCHFQYLRDVVILYHHRHQNRSVLLSLMCSGVFFSLSSTACIIWYFVSKQSAFLFHDGEGETISLINGHE